MDNRFHGPLKFYNRIEDYGNVCLKEDNFKQYYLTTDNEIECDGKKLNLIPWLNENAGYISVENYMWVFNRFIVVVDDFENVFILKYR